MKIPLIWCNPDMQNTSEVVSDSLISSVDYAPTLLNLLGIKQKFQPPDMQGKDMSLCLIIPINNYVIVAILKQTRR